MSNDYLSRRANRSGHWATGAGFAKRRRRQSAAARRTALLGHAALSLERIADPENLLQIFLELKAKGGPAPGIDGLSWQQLSTTEIAAGLRQVSRAIFERRYRPYPTRNVQIPKANGGFRTLNIGVLCDRVVAAALYKPLSTTVDPLLSALCYGFRPGLSTLHLLARLERTMIERDHYVLATNDVRDAFGSVRIGDALADFTQAISDPGVLWLLETILRGANGPLRTLGIEQGSAISPITLNVRLTVCLDRPYAADPANPLLLRWADDLVCAVSSVSDGRQAIQRVADLLAPAGFQLKREDRHAINLHRQGAQVGHLGYCLRWRNGGLMLEIPRQAWAKLQSSLNQAQMAANPCGNAKQIITGWLDHYGLAIGGEDVIAVITRVMGIAADLGFRELGAMAVFEETVRESQARWARIRRAESTRER